MFVLQWAGRSDNGPRYPAGRDPLAVKYIHDTPLHRKVCSNQIRTEFSEGRREVANAGWQMAVEYPEQLLRRHMFVCTSKVYVAQSSELWQDTPRASRHVIAP